MDRPPDDTTVELIDAGDGRRLERFGRRIVDRPAPAASEPRRRPGSWRDADLRFEVGRGWRPAAVAPWSVRIAGLAMELRPTSAGGLGLYPEHASNLAWLAQRIEAATSARRAARASGDGAGGGGAGGGAVRVLNLFAHTGLVTLAAARAGAEVAHVDAARSSVAWARENAAANRLEDRPIRWLVDDAGSFVAREARRGRRYDGVVLDPPSFGHASTGRWQLDTDLAGLLEGCARISAPDVFMLLTAHTAGVAREELAAATATAFHRRLADADIVPLELRAASGAVLPLGTAIRLAG